MIQFRQKTGELPARIRPSLYVDWAKSNDISLPNELIEAVQKAKEDLATLENKNAELEKNNP